jgi:1-acyl-sn-glycerol-3-phosphate acyltransferase
MNALVAVYIYTLVPEFLMRFLAWLLVHTVYRVHREGLENIPDEGPCVIVCNHVSYVDAVVIAACVRRPIRFVMDHRIFRVPILSFIFRAMRTIPIASARDDPALKDRALAEAAAALAAGEIVGIFPEGRLTHTGELNRFRAGVRQIVETTPVPVVPMALRGLWGSLFSRSRSRQGRAGRSTMGLCKRIALVAAAPVPAEDATTDVLFGQVLALRGDAR